MTRPRRLRHARPPGAPHIDRCGPTGKHRYRSIGAARLALELIQETADQRLTERREARWYHCWYCNGYHLTSQAKGEGPRSLARRIERRSA